MIFILFVAYWRNLGKLIRVLTEILYILSEKHTKKSGSYHLVHFLIINSK
jgi:hypothetical protein